MFDAAATVLVLAAAAPIAVPMGLSWEDILKSAVTLLFGGAGVGAGGAALVTVMRAWLRNRPNFASGQASIQAAQATFQEALTAQATAFMTSMREVVADQRGTIDDLERRLSEQEDEARKCHSENRNLRQLISSLIRLLRKAGIDIPKDLAVTAILELEDDGVATFTTLARAGHARTPDDDRD
jgi:hypothetical protein